VLILMTMFFTGSPLLAVLAVPRILGKIPPNGWYGFRVKKTMENPEIWYPVNVYSGKWLLAIGLIDILPTVGFSYVPGISVEVYSIAVLVVWVVVFIVGLVASFRYMNSL
jgi:hypothetical protein